MDDNSLSALLKANQETHRNMMILHYRQSWEESELMIGYSPTPTTATQTRHQDDGPVEQGESVVKVVALKVPVAKVVTSKVPVQK